ncbi:GNAT family N-acetyltransferase [Shimazuella kribbensis]|uniref:GNAT family N-acetyltransferase n=1 Tax=Shimazuella kribbensis TaxID=139808 RepID=UPI0003F8E532|nr:GNAT family N-acetyltransferase [Shimazuella kribbensis]
MNTKLSFPDNLHRLQMSADDGRVVLKIYSPEHLSDIGRVIMERGEKPTFSFSGVRGTFSTEAEVCRHVVESLEGMQKKEIIPFSIFVDGKIRGVVHLGGIDLIDRRATIQRVLIDPDFQGQGIAPNAVQTLVRWAMEVIRFDILLIDVAKGNESSRKMIRRCNFRYKGEKEQFYLDVCGNKNTLLTYAINQTNWNKHPTWFEIVWEQLSDLLM